MATVRVYAPTEREAASPGQRQQAFDQGQGQIGQGLQALGQGLNQYAEAKDAFNARLDEAAAAELDASFANAVRGIERDFTAAQGKNAVEMAEQSQKAWNETAASYLAQAKNPRQSQMLNAVLNRRRERWTGQYDRHLTNEGVAWQTSSKEARLATHAVDVTMMPVGSPERVEGYLEANALLDDLVAFKGGDREMRKQLGLQYFSGIHENTVSSLVEDARPHEAMTYLEENRDTIDPAKFTVLRGRVREQVDTFDAKAFALSQNFGADGESVTVATDALWEEQKVQESGNRQFDRNGRLITSRAGAFGVAQLMPDTARYIAEAMGDPSLAEKARTDPAVNERMGKWYMNQQMAKYGLPSLALAAYNAGPGRVDKWLVTIGDPRRGAMTEAEWAERIPFDETRTYVANIMRKAGGAASGVQQVVPESVALARARAAAGDDPRRQAAFEAATLAQRRVYEADRADTRRAAREAVQKYLPDGSDPVASWTDIPAREWGLLDPEYKNTVRRAFETAQNSDANVDLREADDLVLFFRQNAAGLGGPQAQQEFMTMDLTAFRDDLTRGQFNALRDLQTDLRAASQADPKGNPLGDVGDVITRYNDLIGLRHDRNNPDPETTRRAALFATWMQERALAFQRLNKKAPNRADLDGMAALGARHVEVEVDGERRRVRAFESGGQRSYLVIPAMHRRDVIQRLSRPPHNLRNPSSEQIQDFYNRGVAEGLYPVVAEPQPRRR